MVVVLGLICVAATFVAPPALFAPIWASAMSAGYSAQLGRRESLLSEGYDFGKGALFLRSMSHRLVQGRATDEERIAALMMWSHENVRPSYAAPDRVEGGNFYDIVRRGFGYCDQSAHVLSTLAYYAGYDARLALLRRSDGVSPHSVAEIRVGDRWIAVDPWLGVMLRDGAGKLLGILDFATQPELLREFGYSRSVGLTSGDFGRATVLRTFPYQDLGAFLQKVPSRLFQLPILPQAAMIRPATPKHPAPGQVAAARSPEQEIALYDAARRAHLDGRYMEAVSGYERVLEGAVDRDIIDSAQFFAALALLRAGEAMAAINAFDRALNDVAETPWRKSSLYYRAEAKESVRDVEGAIADLEAADVPPSRIRTRELHSRDARRRLSQ